MEGCGDVWEEEVCVCGGGGHCEGGGGAIESLGPGWSVLPAVSAACGLCLWLLTVSVRITSHY